MREREMLVSGMKEHSKSKRLELSVAITLRDQLAIAESGAEPES